MPQNNDPVGDQKENKLSREGFLNQVAGTVFAGLIAPVLGADEEPVTQPQGIPNREDLEPIIDLPESVTGEHPHRRMMVDLHRALEKPKDQRKWAMVIDLRKCTGCNGCNIACISENKLPPGTTYRPVMTENKGSYPNVSKRFVPRPCMQCEDPPCVPVCPVNATWKRDDGIVTISYDKCIGCRYCITACPYSARVFDSGHFYGEFAGGERQPYEELPSPEYKEYRVREKGRSPIGNARKCHFCIHRIERGELPACVLTCMGWATFFGDMSDSKSLVSELLGQPNVEILKEEMGTVPKVFYLT